MVSESVYTSKYLDWMSETLKDLVQYSSDWMREIQSLPIEEAEAEYSRSSANGDAVLKELQQSYGRHLDEGGYLQDWAVTESHGLWGPMTKPPTAVEMLLVHVLGMMTGFRFINMARSCELTDEADLSTLRHSAHSPDVRFLASCGFEMSSWPAQMSFRTGIEAAHFFADQCYRFNNRFQATRLRGLYLSAIWGQGSHSYQEATPPDRDYSFSEILDLCKVDRKCARKSLFPCVCVEHLQIVIDYEVAWLKHAFCNSPEPRPWNLEKEQWLTDRHPASESQPTATSNDFAESVPNSFMTLRTATAPGMMNNDMQPINLISDQQPKPKKAKRKYTKNAQQKIAEHWAAVKKSGNEELIGQYLTGAEAKVAKQLFHVSRNTLRESEFYKTRDDEAADWRRRNGKPPSYISDL